MSGTTQTIEAVVPRVLVIDSDEVVVFPSVASAQSWLEPWQLDLGELLLVADESGTSFVPRVEGLRVVLDVAGSVDIEVLRGRLNAAEGTPLAQAVDDYLDRHPTQMRP